MRRLTILTAWHSPMNQKLDSVLAAMEHYVEVMGRLATAMQRGQEALVRMDLSAFEQLTAEQDRLCSELKALQTMACNHADSNDVARTGDFAKVEFRCQRVLLGKRCQALQERIRHLNRVNQYFLNRARQSFEVLLRLATPAQTYLAPSAPPQYSGRSAGRE